MFYSLIKSLQYPKMRGLFDTRESCMLIDEYEHMNKLWETIDIKSWCDCYELYNVFDVILLTDSFQQF